MRQMVPGYGKTADNATYMELNQRLEDAIRELENRKAKENALNDILSEKEYLLDTTSSKKPKGK